MPFNMKNVIKDLLAKRKKRKIVLPKPLSTKSLERQYYRDIITIIDKLIDLTNSNVIPAIESIVRDAGLIRPKKKDSYDEDIDKLIERLKVQFYGLYTEAQIRIIAQKAANRIEDFSTAQLNRQFKRVLGIDPFRYEPFMAQEAKAFTAQNVKLIKSIPEEYFTKLEQQIFRSVQQGKVTKDITEEVTNLYGVTKRRAKLIARDQVSKFNSNLNQLRQKNVGIEKYEWSSSHDERVRPAHAAFDGSIIEWDNPPDSIDGYEWEGNPGEPINCRCVALPVFE